MKKLFNLLLVAGLLCNGCNLMAQPFKVRLSVEFVKEMYQSSRLEIEAKYKHNKKYHLAEGLQLNIYHQIVKDSLEKIGSVITDENGLATFHIQLTNEADSIIKHTFVVKIENQEKFKNGRKKVSFIEVDLIGRVEKKDSTVWIQANLNNKQGTPLEGEKVNISIQRLFAPISVGKSYYKTDKNGQIQTEFGEPLPGVAGMLTFIVSVDSRKYGRVSHVFEAPVGLQVVDRSTFDQRTMWSPADKTPIFLLVFPNLLLLMVWLTIVILITNLIKIYKA